MRRHNPWVNFTNLPASVNQPFSAFPSDFTQLPTLSIVVPNLQDDMHDGTIQQADDWLRTNIDGYAQWAKTHNSLLVVTWDESESPTNQIPTFFVGSTVTPGQYDETINHFTVLRTLEDMYGLPALGASANVQPITDIWAPRSLATAGTSASPTVFTITADNALFRHDPATGWTLLGAAGTILSISAVTETSGNAVVFVVTTDHGLFRFDSNSGWQMLGAPGTINSISAGTDRNGRADVFVLTADTSLTEWSTSSGWLSSPIGGAGSVAAMSAAGNDRVVVVGADHSIVEHDDALGWFPLTSAGFAQSVAAVTDGSGAVTIFAMTLDHALFDHTDATGWNKLGSSGTIERIAAGRGTSGQAAVSVLTSGNQFAQFDSLNGWQSLQLPGVAVELSAASGDRATVILADGSVFQRADPFGFVALTSPGFAHR